MSNPSTRGCWCQRPLLTTRQTGDGKAVGWCAVGPRSRFTRALRSPLMTRRDPEADDGRRRDEEASAGTKQTRSGLQLHGYATPLRAATDRVMAARHPTEIAHYIRYAPRRSRRLQKVARCPAGP
jgi:hypothetical protein